MLESVLKSAKTSSIRSAVYEVSLVSMTTNFNTQLNSEEIKKLISQLSADDVSELKEGLENWLESTEPVSIDNSDFQDLEEAKRV